MKILFVSQHFDYLSGAPVYVYELAKTLKSRGHEVSIMSKCGGDLASKAKQHGIQLYDLANPPREKFDVMHLNQPETTKFALEQYPGVPAVATIHSEYHYETPIIDSRIGFYVAIRPSIKHKLIDEYGIPDGKVRMILNPVDGTRFHVARMPRTWEKKRVLFVGTIDFLRKQTIQDLINRSQEEDFELKIIGKKFDTYLDRNLPENVSWQPAKWNIESEVKTCDETAGVLMGRTTIEGWACGKPGWIYNIDLNGNILSRKLTKVPEPEVMEHFKSSHVAKEMENLYHALI